MAIRCSAFASICVVAVLLFACFAARAASKPLRPPSARSVPMSLSKRIIGGYPVQKGDSPFLVSLQLVNYANRTAQHFCGASVIKGRFLLTAAHCVERVIKNPDMLKAFLGTLRSGSLQTHDNHNHTEDTQEFRVNTSAVIRKVLSGEKVLVESDYEAMPTSRKIRRSEPSKNKTISAEMEYEACIDKIFMHEKYNTTTMENDIAVLVLPMDIPDKFKNLVVPVLLPTTAMEKQGYPADGTECTVYGWGLSHATITMEEWVRDDFIEPKAKKVNIVVRNDTICQRFHQYFFQYLYPYSNKTMFCAGNIGSDYGGTFSGDSGGPVICGHAGKYYQAGIVSFGSTSMGAYMPGFFTRVTAYEDWIKNIISKNS